MKNELRTLVLVAAFPFSLAVKNSTESLAKLTQLPQCALTCLETSVADSTCGLADTACVCNDAPLNAAITACVQSTCTIKQSLVTLNVTHELCEAPVRDQRTSYNILSDIFGIASGVAVALRFFSRWKSSQEFWYDDYSIVVVMALGIPSTIMNVQGLTPNGLGLDIWRVNFDQITEFVHIFFAMELLYFAQIGAIKMSLLFFYLRLFPSPTIRKYIWGTLYFNVVFTTLFILVGLFQCKSISYYWTRWDNEHEGSCMDINALVWANAGISIALDTWMLGLPMTQLLGLKLHWKKKLGVTAMFGVGAFVTVVSIVRLHSLVKFSNSQNATWDYLAIGYWSTIEINVGIICACMPSIRLLLLRAFPRFMGTTGDRSYAHGGSRSAGAKMPSSSLGNRVRVESEAAHSKGGVTVLSKGLNERDEMGGTDGADRSTVELVTIRSKKSGDDGRSLEEPDRNHGRESWTAV